MRGRACGGVGRSLKALSCARAIAGDLVSGSPSLVEVVGWASGRSTPRMTAHVCLRGLPGTCSSPAHIPLASSSTKTVRAETRPPIDEQRARRIRTAVSGTAEISATGNGADPVTKKNVPREDRAHQIHVWTHRKRATSLHDATPRNFSVLLFLMGPAKSAEAVAASQSSSTTKLGARRKWRATRRSRHHVARLPAASLECATPTARTARCCCCSAPDSSRETRVQSEAKRPHARAQCCCCTPSQQAQEERGSSSPPGGGS